MFTFFHNLFCCSHFYKGDPDARVKFQRVSEAYKRITDPDSFKDEDDEGGDFDMDFEQFNQMFQSMFMPMMMGGMGGGGPFNSRGMGGDASMMFDMMMMMEAEMNGGGMGDDDDDVRAP